MQRWLNQQAVFQRRGQSLLGLCYDHAQRPSEETGEHRSRDAVPRMDSCSSSVLSASNLRSLSRLASCRNSQLHMCPGCVHRHMPARSHWRTVVSISICTLWNWLKIDKSLHGIVVQRETFSLDHSELRCGFMPLALQRDRVVP